jgi:hypothetical protein
MVAALSATPPGSCFVISPTGGIAALNPRLIAVTPVGVDTLCGTVNREC